jgi:RNA polymerase sigma-70 factor (ECF subfamily)
MQEHQAEFLTEDDDTSVSSRPYGRPAHDDDDASDEEFADDEAKPNGNGNGHANGQAGGAAGRGWANDPDTTLMMRVRDGDHQAFHDLFLKYRAPLLNFSNRFIGSAERSEELVQEAFLQIYRARERYEPQARLATYLYRVMINLCLNERRRFVYQGRIESLDRSKNPEDDREGRQIADQTIPQVEDYVAGLEVAGKLKKLLKRLPPNQRAALLLSRIEGFSYQEVAGCLDTSVSAVKSLVFRATQTLRDGLRESLR